MTINASVRGQEFPLFAELLGFGLDRAEVSLNTLSVGHRFPEALGRDLFDLLVYRARTAGR